MKTDDAWAREELGALGVSLTGKRYGFIESEIVPGDSPLSEVSAWLAEETSK